MNVSAVPIRTPRWKRYAYRLVAAEISSLTRVSDACLQVAPLPFDQGTLLDSIVCPQKKAVTSLDDLPRSAAATENRHIALLNGNLNYCSDIQDLLASIRASQTRHSRLCVVIYNPLAKFLYALASFLHLRSAPAPRVFITEQVLQNLAILSGYAIERTRPCLFLPVYIPFLSNVLNRILPTIPLVRKFALVWVITLRPAIASTNRPSLSIIVPARNEAGHVPNLVQRIPGLGGAPIEVIFIEGHSTDDTWDRIRAVADHAHPRLKIRAYQQSGKGKNDAVRLGLAQATGDLVTILDADMTMPPECLTAFYEAYCAGHGDLINGSRLVYPMERDAMRPLNRMGNILFAKLLAHILDLCITDTLCGTKLLARRDYQRIIKWREHFGDFDPFGDFDLLFAVADLALGTVDVPIRYGARSYGVTNIQRFRDGLRLVKMTVIGFCKIKLGKSA